MGSAVVAGLKVSLETVRKVFGFENSGIEEDIVRLEAVVEASVEILVGGPFDDRDAWEEISVEDELELDGNKVVLVLMEVVSEAVPAVARVVSVVAVLDVEELVAVMVLFEKDLGIIL